MIRMRASAASALAISTICCWPMRRSLDQRLAGSIGCSSRASSSRARSLLALAIDVDAEADGRIARAMKMFSATERFGQRLSSWKTMPMPVPHGVARSMRKTTGSPSSRMRAGGRLLDAGDDLHQRRLAGAVLADQHVDGGPAHLEVDVVQGDRAGIDLADLLRAQITSASSRTDAGALTSRLPWRWRWHRRQLQRRVPRGLRRRAGEGDRLAGEGIARSSPLRAVLDRLVVEGLARDFAHTRSG